MSDCITVEINADKGATLVSPNFFAIEETAPDGATIADIERGIASGEFTVIDPNLYTYQGMIKLGYDKAALVNLTAVISVKSFEHPEVLTSETPEGHVLGTITGSYSVVTFKVLPVVTAKWQNKEHTLVFDIKRTEIADTTNIDVWVKGNINVLPVVTE